jgi:hypothetical protein
MSRIHVQLYPTDQVAERLHKSRLKLGRGCLRDGLDRAV